MSFKMNQQIQSCSSKRTSSKHCSLTFNNKGWGCRFLATPIAESPATETEKAKIFSAVYREAKHKGVLDCPHYRSLFIDEVLEQL